MHCEPCDIVSNSSVEALATRIKEQWGRLDVVVVNSGFAGPLITRVTEGDPDDWKRCFEVNTIGTYYAAHHLLPLLLRSPGARAFVVVSASAAWITEGVIANSGYCISKLAQLRLVEMVARQYEGEGLLSVGVHPGAVATEMARSAPEEFRKCKLLFFNLQELQQQEQRKLFLTTCSGQTMMFADTHACRFD